jgi:DNA (cytosine-5)-methyltransferase 1
VANTTLHLAHHTLGTHRGAKRVWLEGKRLADAGFLHGVRYQVVAQGDALQLRLTPAGDHTVSGSEKRPVVDLHPEQLLASLGAVERVEVRFCKRQVLISILPIDRAAAERLVRLNSRLAGGQRLRLGSLCHGGGVASDAILRGLGNAQLSWAVEQDGGYIEQSLEHGPAARGAVTVEADLGDVDPTDLDQVEILEAGLPCTAASRAGRAKKGITRPEDQADLADLAVAFLEVIRATQPAVIVLENVPEYASSATADIIRARLRRFGYEIHETRLDGAEWALEARQRWLLVAVTRGLDFDPASLVPSGDRPAALGEVLDRRTPAAAWRSTAGLEAKAAKDKALGRGFSRGRKQLTPEATSVPTLRRGYQKGGSCDVRLAHPTRANTARLFSAAEHARIKGIDPHLVSGLSEKRAHEVLGQSVIAPAFRALGAALREALP